MIESPFVTISKIIQEETLLSDTLDILAKDTSGIRESDREAMREAAEEMRHMRQLIVNQHQQIKDLNAQITAAGERIKALTPLQQVYSAWHTSAPQAHSVGSGK